MATPIRRTGLGHAEADIGKEDRRGIHAVGRRATVGGEDTAADWDTTDTGEAPLVPTKPAPRSEKRTDRGWG